METISRQSHHHWMTISPASADPNVVERCTADAIAEALKDIPDATVHSVAINREGKLDVPAGAMSPAFVESDMPEYCEVIVHHSSAGNYVAKVTVWVPLTWNDRFLGTSGGGNRLTLGLMPTTASSRILTLATALRNGFATASTDGAVGDDPRVTDWQFNEDTGENDSELIENWVHRGTHDMTVIGKAVTAAIHGRAPRFSYFQGISGGGRQAIASALYHPEDYDGVWSDVPAINWTRFIPAEFWPPVVMKELNNPLSPIKLEAFRQAAVDDFNLINGVSEAFITSVEPHDFDPYRLVGQHTDDGEITETDARVMRMIWDGPITPEGERLWFGVRPGVETWGWNPSAPGLGLCVTTETPEGDLAPDPFYIAHAWFRTWMLRDPDWDWTMLTMDEYFALFSKGLEEFAHVAVDDPDLSEFRDHGAKLLLTHGLDDPLIFAQGTQHYFDRVLDEMGGFAEVSEFARFFPCAGDGHGGPTSVKSFGADVATGMMTLMNWVEKGDAPDFLDTLHFSEEGQVNEVRRVEVYGADRTPTAAD